MTPRLHFCNLGPESDAEMCWMWVVAGFAPGGPLTSRGPRWSAVRHRGEIRL